MTEQFKFLPALHSLRNDLFKVYEEFGDQKSFGSRITKYIRPELPGRKLVELTVVSDCLRAFAHIASVESVNEQIRGELKYLLRSFAALNLAHFEFQDLRDDQLRKAFCDYREDTRPFGFHHESSMWSGMETCSNVDLLAPNLRCLLTYRTIISNWVKSFKPDCEIMNIHKFGETFAKCRGPNVQLRPNVICRALQIGDKKNEKKEVQDHDITKRIAYWELLELSRENVLQYGSYLRDENRLTPKQKVEREQYFDPGRQVRHFWPEKNGEDFQPFAKTFANDPFEQLPPKSPFLSELAHPKSDTESTNSESNSQSSTPSTDFDSDTTSNSVPSSSNGSVEPSSSHLERRHPAAGQPSVSAEEEKSIIIESPFNSTHIVFAPPGTGKTYALVKRLARLISEGQITNPSLDVLILSFSRAAVSEIVKRMQDEAEDSGDNNLRYVQIRTFDSYAARAMTMGSSQLKLANSYSENIRNFCQLLSDRALPDESLEQIDQIKLLVVDEIQDLVGERARMTLALIKQVLTNSGSILLLGDPAQAIYDWQLEQNDTMTSAKFISCARSLMTTVGKGYAQKTFEHYHRFENQRLLEFVRACRLAIGDDGESPDMTGLRNELNDFGTEIPEERLSSESTSTHSVAVLTRTNLEAFQLSEWCGGKAINHRVERGASGRYWPGWIARLCFGFKQSTMSASMIKQRWEKFISENERVDLNTAIVYLENHGVYQNEQLDVESLSQLIEKSQPLTLWPPGDDYGMTISTIHRSKGLQFDRVAILEPELGNFSGGDASIDKENARVIYVAATRAKSELLRLSRNRKIFRKGRKCNSKKSRNRLQHFQLWDSAKGMNHFLLDGTDEFDLYDYMETVKSNSFKEIHEAIWDSRSLSSKLEVVVCDSIWTWQLNGKRLCRVSAELESTLSTFNKFLSYHEKKIENLSLVPIVDVASVSFAWRGDRSVEKVLGKARLALVPVVYGLALVNQAASNF